jgi:precorrin-3B synthase
LQVLELRIGKAATRADPRARRPAIHNEIACRAGRLGDGRDLFSLAWAVHPDVVPSQEARVGTGSIAQQMALPSWSPPRRGACPGILVPMMTGDGLLARLTCDAPIPLGAFAALCEVSARDGNGGIEVTQRGNLQFRGLTTASAPDFARSVTSLGLGTATSGNLIGTPLAGLDGLEELDTCDLLTEARALLARPDLAASLGPKVSVLIDGGGKLHLDRVRADIRLRPVQGRFNLALSGDDSTAVLLGSVHPQDALTALDRVAALIAARGPAARARDFLTPPGLDAARSALGSLITDATRPGQRAPAEPIGTHVLKHSGVARGFGLPYGHSTCGALKRLALVAAARGADSIRPAPGRALLVLGLPPEAADDLAATVAEDFVVEPDDRRLQVVACTGSPGCASATLPTRALAPDVVRAAGGFLDGSVTLHLSGCAKGCAHPGRAALTLSGPGRVILNGCADDPAHRACSATELLAGLERLRDRRAGHACTSAELMSRLGPARVLEILRGDAQLG